MLPNYNIKTEPIRIDKITQKRFVFFEDPDQLPIELYKIKNEKKAAPNFKFYLKPFTTQDIPNLSYCEQNNLFQIQIILQNTKKSEFN